MDMRRWASVGFFFLGVLQLLTGLQKGETVHFAIAVLAFGAAYRQYTFWRQENGDEE